MVKKEKWFINQVLDALELIPVKSLSTYERIIIIAIAKYADKNGFCWPTLFDIENISGIPNDHINRYFPSLKQKKILQIKRKWCKVKRMTKNFYTVNLNAIIKLSIDENGVIEVEKETCIEIEPTATVASCSNIDKPKQTPVAIGLKVVCAEIEPLATVATEVPIEANNPVEQKDIVQDKALDTSLFDDFWASYPRKEKKKEAYKIWVKNKLDKIGNQIIKDLIDRQARHDRWEDRAYIPLPTTYLNGEQWNDEIIERIKTPQKQNSQFLSKRESNILDLGNEARALAARRNTNGRIS